MWTILSFSPLLSSHIFTLHPLLSSLLFSSGWGDGESRNKTSPIIVKPSFLSEHYRFDCCLYLGDVTHSDSSCAAVIATTAISAGILVNRQKWIYLNSCNDSSLINGSLPSFNSSIPISAISPSLPVVSLPLSLSFSAICRFSPLFPNLFKIYKSSLLLPLTNTQYHSISLLLSLFALCSYLSLSVALFLSLSYFFLHFSPYFFSRYRCGPDLPGA